MSRGIQRERQVRQLLEPRIVDQATLELRFWAKVDKSSECWLWTGNRTTAGYGQIRQNKISKQAHRVAYEWLVGPIPTGYVIDHLCENPSCVNPLHLEPVSAGVNIERQLGKRTTCKYGHPLDGICRNGDRMWRRYCKACDRAKNRRRREARRGN